ncbi:MAG: pilus assembly protein PilM [Planctomycetes bacterium]|nr:pilus assembly protein PilM [Planctomycetota bacterium]
MSQSIGIHLGEHAFHLVALEGGLKRHKLVCAVSGEIPSGEGAAQAVIEALREIVKDNKLSGDNVNLAIDSGAAAFRSLTLPFDDREKIEEVLKFEVEGNLPQYDIDQVVVDFQVLSSKPGVESNLLVTAVPKDRLRAALQLCERAGLEPLDAELEGTALFDAAYESGILQEEAGTVLIHVGDTSTTVVVADGRRLSSLRAIRVGAHTPRVSESPEGDVADVKSEIGKSDIVKGELGKSDVAKGDAAKGETKVEVKAEAPAGGEGEATRQVASAQRIRRELARTLSGARTTNEIRQIFVCGHELPGLSGESLLDLPIQALPFKLDDADPARLYVIAFGAALRGFDGGTLAPKLRREDLRFSGRFERLELPLAVFTLLLFTFLFVQYIVLDQQLEWRDEGNLAAAEPIKGDMQIWLEASNQRLLSDPTNPTRAVRLPNAPEDLVQYASEAAAGRDLERTKFGELMEIRNKIKRHIDRLSKELGQVSEIEQPQSALAASTLVMSVISEMGSGARIGIRRLEASYQSGAGNKDDFVIVSIDADFFGENSLEATRAYNQLESQFKSQPWCIEFESKSSKSLAGDRGIQLDGLTIQVNVDKSPLGGQQP